MMRKNDHRDIAFLGRTGASLALLTVIAGLTGCVQPAPPTPTPIVVKQPPKAPSVVATGLYASTAIKPTQAQQSPLLAVSQFVFGGGMWRRWAMPFNRYCAGLAIN